MSAVLLAALAVAGGMRYTRSSTIRIKYGVKDASGLAKVELWVTSDEGKTWAKACEDEDLKPPVVFTAPSDGRYGFALVLEDAVGNRNPEPRPGQAPGLVLVVDTSPPELSFSLSGRFAGPKRAVVASWSCADPNLPACPVSLHLSSANGEELLAESLKAAGAFEWKPGEDCSGKFRIVARASDLARNVSKAESEAITADSVPPRATVVAPETSATNLLSVEVRAGDEGGSGLAELLVHASGDGGKTWKTVARGDPGARELSFPVEPGEWQLCGGAVDNSGNSTPAPAVQARVTVEEPPLKLKLVRQPPTLRGGDSFRLAWKCAPPEAKLPGGVDLHWRPAPDGEWTAVASSQPREGEFTWKAPAEDCERAQFRLDARTADGVTASVLSREFVIDASAPVAVLAFDLGDAAATEPPREPRATAEAGAGETPTPAVAERREPPRRAPDAGSIEALIEAGDFTGAVKEATALLSAGPADARALVLRARAKALMGDLDRAEADLMRASALPGADAADDLLPRVLLAKAVRCWEDGRKSGRYAGLALKACKDAETAGGLVSKALACYMLACINQASRGEEDTEMLERAREGFERALAVSRGKLEGICRWYLARIMESQGRPEAAREHWRKAAELFPEGSRQRELAGSKGPP